MKNVTSWKCFSNADRRVKDFYARRIGYSLSIDNLQLLEDVLVAMLIICQSANCEPNSECYKQREWLWEKIATFDYQKLYEEESEVNAEYHKIQIIEVEVVEESTEILQYLNQLNFECQKKCSNTNNDNGFLQPNYLECLDLVENLINLYSQFPAWTNTMNPYYPSAKEVSTSTGSEVFFRILRHDLDLSHPISANRFVLKILKFIDGDTKIGRALIKEIKDHLKFSDENATTDAITETKTKLQKKQHKIVERVNETDNVNLKNLTIKDAEKKPICKSNKSRKLTKIIQNGNLLPCIEIDGEKLYFINTCAFDGISEILLTGYRNSDIFKRAVNEFLDREDNIFLRALRDFHGNNSIDVFYTKRAEILLPLVPRKENNVTINCETNVTSLFEKLIRLFSDRLNLVTCKAQDCMWEKTLRYQTKIIDDLTLNDF